MKLSLSSRPALRLTLVPVLVASVLALAACGGDDPLAEQSPGDTGSAGASGSLTVGGADFTEMKIMESMYQLLLEDAGFTVDVKPAAQREIYAPALESGEVDVVPEYAATMAEYLNRQANGPDAPAISSPDADATVAAMKPLAEAKGLTVLEPSKALDANGFYVTKKFADDNGLKTLSDLAALGQPITLAAGDECLERPFCAIGLKNTYGLNITGVTGDDFGSLTGKQKVVNGTAQLGLTGTTDGTLEGLGLVVLEDDKKLQAADNLVPVVNTESASDPKIAEALNKLADTLTTADLTELNAKVDGERQKPEDVARDYLESKNLIG